MGAEAQKIRRSVLQAAISGKLVPQDPNEEPAVALLERITAEKEQLIKEKKIKKQKPLPPVSEKEQPFEIPESWEWTHMVDLLNVRSANRIHKSDWRASGVPFLRGRELVQMSKTGIVDSEVFISQDLYDQLSAKSRLPQKGDILISAVGTLGRTYVMTGDEREFYYKDAYILCLENFGKINAMWLNHMLQSPYAQSYIHQDSMGTTVAQLTIDKQRRMFVPVPPLAEQRRIVRKLEEVLPLVNELAGTLREADITT